MKLKENIEDAGRNDNVTMVLNYDLLSVTRVIGVTLSIGITIK